MCDVAGIYAQGHIPILWNVCILALAVTVLIAVSSYEVIYIDIVV